MLIRVRKAPKDAKGKTITYNEIELQDAIDKGFIETPHKYSEGKYNTLFCNVSATEFIIFEAKMRRSNPTIRELLEALFISTNKKFEKKSDLELKDYCEKNLLSVPPKDLALLGKYEYLDMKFFSQYIPQLGFMTSAEFITNCPAKGIFYVVCSLNPPGSLYQKPGILPPEDSNLSTDVKVIYKLDFDSPSKAITFHDKEQLFYISRPDVNSMLIYEIFNVNVKNGEIASAESFGFSILPIFQYVEVDSDLSTIEIYINSNIYQLPIFKGTPNPEFVEKVINKENVLEYQNRLIADELLEVVPKASLMVKLIDNQLEHILREPESAYRRLDVTYMPEKFVKQAKFFYAKDYAKSKDFVSHASIDKTAPMSKMLPKGIEKEGYEAKIYDYVQSRYT